MKRIIICILLPVSLLAGCSGEKKAAELLETARFEEKQTNREHAVKLYKEIVAKYPGTPAAASAKTRLDELKR